MTPGEITKYFEFLSKECSYTDIRILPNNKWVAIAKYLFTHAIIVGSVGDYCGIDDRWCYHDYPSALKFLEKWSGNGEPDGWHRHPSSGRRRDNGDPKTEYINL